MSRPQHGFTLVETLVALSVSALLVTLVYGVVVISQRSAQAVNERATQGELMHIGWQFLHDAITRAQPISNPLDREDATSFDGTERQLNFIADQPAYIGPGGLTRIGIGVDATQETRRLVVTRKRFDPNADDEPGEPDQTAVLVDDLELLRIRYFGSTDDDSPGDWLPEWQEAPFIPSLVQIQVKPRGGPAWPLLVARPMAGTTAAVDLEAPIEDDAVPAPDEQDNEPRADEDLPINART